MQAKMVMMMVGASTRCALRNVLFDMGVTHSPDGAKITYTSVRRAITWQDGYQ